MFEEGVRLNQIVSDKQVRRKYWSQMHKVNNSLKRSSTHAEATPIKDSTFYECRLPEVQFGRKDLSLILRYLLTKREMSLADRNLLRRILISIFDEDLISAGTKKFIQFLRFEEGDQRYDITQKDSFYFLMKGSGIVKTANFVYQIKKGDIFGQLQILSNESIKSIEFDGGYIMLVLNKSSFDLFYRNYFFNLYHNRERQLCCLTELYFNKISLFSKYMILKSVQYRTYSYGDKIVEKDQKIDNIYFMSHHSHKKPEDICRGCLGLFQTINNINGYVQTMVCQRKKLKIVYLPVSVFRNFALNGIGIEKFESVEMDKSIISLNKSFLAINGLEPPKQRLNLGSFLTKKKVKISMKYSRVKTQMSDYCQTDFKFLKTQFSNSSFLNKTKNATPLSSSLSKKYNSSKLSKRTY